ncbi:MAG TPA: 30S ribosomal protein S12 methylthiotransferase RimO [Candidatus Omnitrophota bacterium]|nr:30S ribosomal protein S12 methylthiotransferase RimO [Candidatus Omnitrophota bacterium]HPS20296.1 30S ribosomal protein S12 methylthiotransferase RimO [Candidatus Omnitrophota bacterium]
MTKIYFLSLGCPRNLVDSEVLEALLEKRGFTFTNDPARADVGIVNTCAFIDSAKEESIDAILSLARYKKEGRLKKIVVTGCLSQRYPKTLVKQLKEVDAFFGVSNFNEIPSFLGKIISGERYIKTPPSKFEFLYDGSKGRISLTPPHYSYIKIQEGCSNNCSYCVIPFIRGPLRSRTVGSIKNEVKSLRKNGVKEFILIGQDITAYRGGELAGLLKEVSPIVGDNWLRLLYCHPARFTDGLINAIAKHDNVCKYIDIPVQHINDRILKAMNRRITSRDIYRLIDKIRNKIDGAVLRTSVIVGFPGETEKEFRQLMSFLKETRFERLGAFVYSREDGTSAARMTRQIPERVKNERFDELMKFQQTVARDFCCGLIGKKLEVIIDEEVASGGGEYIGRSYMDAPEIDGVIYIKGHGLKVGDFANVSITGSTEYDLHGEMI